VRKPVPLREAGDESAFGGKATQLALAAAAGLPVPPGLALSWSLAEALAAGDPDVTEAVRAAAEALGPSLAVRSSALGEDSAAASFAGRHATLLGVPAAGVRDAVEAVSRSVRSESAVAYRRRLAIAGAPRAGVVIQRMVSADVAGVLFYPHPVTGADEIVVEASWGLGEAVVGGLVTPDFFRLSPRGDVVERRPGVKEVELVVAPGGGTAPRPVTGERILVPCLDEGQLARLHLLSTRCREVFGGSQDLEWAFADEALWLLQRRAVTGTGTRASV
jgi:pyruvate,water dikinase